VYMAITSYLLGGNSFLCHS